MNFSKKLNKNKMAKFILKHILMLMWLNYYALNLDIGFIGKIYDVELSFKNEPFLFKSERTKITSIAVSPSKPAPVVDNYYGSERRILQTNVEKPLTSLTAKYKFVFGGWIKFKKNTMISVTNRGKIGILYGVDYEWANSLKQDTWIFTIFQLGFDVLVDSLDNFPNTKLCSVMITDNSGDSVHIYLQKINLLPDLAGCESFESYLDYFISFENPNTSTFGVGKYQKIKKLVPSPSNPKDITTGFSLKKKGSDDLVLTGSNPASSDILQATHFFKFFAEWKFEASDQLIDYLASYGKVNVLIEYNNQKFLTKNFPSSYPSLLSVLTNSRGLKIPQDTMMNTDPFKFFNPEFGSMSTNLVLTLNFHFSNYNKNIKKFSSPFYNKLSSCLSERKFILSLAETFESKM